MIFLGLLKAVADNTELTGGKAVGRSEVAVLACLCPANSRGGTTSSNSKHVDISYAYCLRYRCDKPDGRCDSRDDNPMAGGTVVVPSPPLVPFKLVANPRRQVHRTSLFECRSAMAAHLSGNFPVVSNGYREIDFIKLPKDGW